MKPRVRVKALTRVIGPSMPADAQPGDLLLGNRGAAARVVAHRYDNGHPGCLYLAYAGNYGMGNVFNPDGKVHDFR